MFIQPLPDADHSNYLRFLARVAQAAIDIIEIAVDEIAGDSASACRRAM